MAPQPVPDEEEAIARFGCLQTSQTGIWGKLKRIVSVTPGTIRVLDPSSLQASYVWSVAGDVEAVAPVASANDEFTISVRDAKKAGKTKTFAFSCPHRARLLGAMHTALAAVAKQTPRFYAASLLLQDALSAKVTEKDVLLGVTATALEVVDPRTAETIRRFFFSDSLRCCTIQGDKRKFVLFSESMAGELPHVYACHERNDLVSTMLKESRARLGVSVSLTDEPVTAAEYFRQRDANKHAFEDSLATATSVAEFEVTKILFDDGGPSHRVLCITTENQLVERHPSTYAAVGAWALDDVTAIVRHATEAQKFSIEFHGSLDSLTYTSTSRDALLSVLLDSVRSVSGGDIAVQPSPTDTGSGLDPASKDIRIPANVDATAAPPFRLLTTASTQYVDLSTLLKQLQMVARARARAIREQRATDAQAMASASAVAHVVGASMAPAGGLAPRERLALEGGDNSDTQSVMTTMTEADALEDDGTDTVLHAVSEKTLWLRMREFNAVVPYTGVPVDTKVKEDTIEALTSMLPNEAGSLPTGSAAADAIVVLQVLHRLMSCRSARLAMTTVPNALDRLFAALSCNDDGVAAESARVIKRLLCSYGPVSQTAQFDRQIKDTVLGGIGASWNASIRSLQYREYITSRMLTGVASPLLSQAIIDVLDVLVCPPHSMATSDALYFDVLGSVAEMGRELFRLFGHSAPGVVTSVGIIMKTVADECPDAAPPMRDAALAEAAVLRHFYLASFSPSDTQRQVSQQLVSIWATGHAATMDMLARALPRGLLAELAPPDADELAERAEKEAYEQELAKVRADARSQLLHEQRIEQYRAQAERRAKRLAARDALIASGATLTSEQLKEYADTDDEADGDDDDNGNGNDKSAPPAVPERTTATNRAAKVAAAADGDKNLPPVDEMRALADATGRSYRDESPSLNKIVDRAKDLAADASDKARQMAGEAAQVSREALEKSMRAAEQLGAKVQKQALAAKERVRERLNKVSARVAHVNANLWRRLLDSADKYVIRRERPRTAAEHAANWQALFERLHEDHRNARLIWNERTRVELRESLETELDMWDQEQLRRGSQRISWNHAEFRVDFPSLAREVVVGDLYLRLLLDNTATGPGGKETAPVKVRPRAAPRFFNELYHRLYVEDDPDTRRLCVRGMAIMYERYSDVIGFFFGTTHVTRLCDATQDTTLRHALLLLLKRLLVREDNAALFMDAAGINLLCDLLSTAHENTDRVQRPIEADNMLTSTADAEYRIRCWYYVDAEGESRGPVSKSELRDAFQRSAISVHTACWVQDANTVGDGADAARALIEYRELRWSVASFGRPVLTYAQLGLVIMGMLSALCRLRATVDQHGDPIRPVPRAQRLLTARSCIGKIAQTLLTNDPLLTGAACNLLLLCAQNNDAVMSKLYTTGVFFFALTYGGGDFIPVARLLKETHTKQHFYGFEALAAGEAPLSQRSVLGTILPHSLLYALESSSYSDFARLFTGNTDNPEVIWHDKMRGRLIAQLFTHLGDFPRLLPEQNLLVFDYVPMPSLSYPELKDELWCHRYYLKNLCNEISFPNWPVVDLLETMQAILTIWKAEEDAAAPAQITFDEACEILGVARGTDESTLKKAYRKKALKFHPDKNPDGGPMFQKITLAYELLQADNEGIAQKSGHRLTLILQAQNILYKRFTRNLSPFKYAGYPLLLDLIMQDASLANDRGPLFLAGTELMYHTCVSSSLNGDELCRQQGVTVCSRLLERALGDIGEGLTPDTTAAKVATHLCMTYAGLAALESGRNAFRVKTDAIEQVLRCVRLDGIPRLVDAALRCVRNLAEDDGLRDVLVQQGALWHLVPLLLRYDHTAQGDLVKERFTNVQKSRNYQAILAANGLRRLSPNTCANMAGRAVLTHHLWSQLVTGTDEAVGERVLVHLNGTIEQPLLIWNTDTRAELATLVDSQFTERRQTGRFDPRAGHQFEYKAHKRELVVGGVFIRVYNVKGGGDVGDQALFCKALSAFIKNANGLGEDGTIPDATAVVAPLQPLAMAAAASSAASDTSMAQPPLLPTAASPAPASSKAAVEAQPVLVSAVDPFDGLFGGIPTSTAVPKAAPGSGYQPPMFDLLGDFGGGGSLSSSAVPPRSAPTPSSNAPALLDLMSLDMSSSSATTTTPTTSAAVMVPTSTLGGSAVTADSSAAAPTATSTTTPTSVAKRAPGKFEQKGDAGSLCAVCQALARLITTHTVESESETEDSAVNCGDVLAEDQGIPGVFACLAWPLRSRVPAAALKVVTHLTSSGVCTRAIAESVVSLVQLIRMLFVCGDAELGEVLDAVQVLASNPFITWEAASRGGALYLLSRVMDCADASSATPEASRIQAAKTLAKMAGDRTHGPKVAIVLSKFLPAGLVGALRETPASMVTVLRSKSNTPELIWNGEMLKEVTNAVRSASATFYQQQTHNMLAVWTIPERSQVRGAAGSAGGADGGLMVAGVYVELFLKEPKHPLRNPKKFLEGLLETFTEEAIQGGDESKLGLLQSALVALLRISPQQCDHVNTLGYPGRFIQTLKDGDPLDSSRATVIQVCRVCAPRRSCAETFSTTAGTVQTLVRMARAATEVSEEQRRRNGARIDQISDAAMDTLRMLADASNNGSIDALCMQTVRSGCVQQLLDMLDPSKSATLGLAKVHAVDALKRLGARDQRIALLLDGSTVWNIYKDQRHDLYLPSTTTAPVAGYLTGGDAQLRLEGRK